MQDVVVAHFFRVVAGKSICTGTCARSREPGFAGGPQRQLAHLLKESGHGVAVCTGLPTTLNGVQLQQGDIERVLRPHWNAFVARRDSRELKRRALDHNMEPLCRTRSPGQCSRPRLGATPLRLTLHT